MSEKKYRHELKYLISAAQIPILKTLIAAIMQPDAHAAADGTYASAACTLTITPTGAITKI